MSRRAGLAAVILLTWIASSPFAQSAGDHSSSFELGRAALAAHDPAKAIAQFELVTTREGHEWLAVALMMESRSPSDQYVERAFESALRARIDRPGQARSRRELAASLRPGDVVIALLVSETYAYAWAFDRDAFVGYPLPSSADLAAETLGARTYIDQNDQAGVQRIAEHLMPALLGPVEERLSKLQRVIFVTDGPLQRVPITELARSEFPPELALITSDYDSLSDTLTRAQSEPAANTRAPRSRLLAIGSIVAILIVAAVVVTRRRRASVP
jgi:hypothetical protein